MPEAIGRTTRYTKQELQTEAVRIARSRGGRLVRWEIVVGEQTGLVVYYEVRVPAEVDRWQTMSTNMVL